MESEREREFSIEAKGNGVKGSAEGSGEEGDITLFKEMVDLKKNIRQIVHEINNPLQNLFNIAQLITMSTRDKDDQRLTTYVSKISTESQRIDALLKRLLETINRRVDDLTT